MFRSGQFLNVFKPHLGTRAVSSENVQKVVSEQWYRSDRPQRNSLLGNVNTEQWEGRGLDKTPVTVLNISGAGVHTSFDPYPHFTGRAFNDKGEAVWFFDTKVGFFTNGIHFYPNGLPKDLDKDRFEAVPSNDPNLIAWCAANGRDIKMGKKNN